MFDEPWGIMILLAIGVAAVAWEWGHYCGFQEGRDTARRNLSGTAWTPDTPPLNDEGEPA